MPSILFVCLGNICRSPAAEGMMLKLAEESGITDLRVDSCGLGDWHIGQLPDERMREAAMDRDIVLTMKARQIHSSDFDRFDLILAASRSVLNELYVHAKTPEAKAKIRLITAFSKAYKDQDIPDPYYKDLADFELVLDMLEDACEGILEEFDIKN